MEPLREQEPIDRASQLLDAQDDQPDFQANESLLEHHYREQYTSNARRDGYGSYHVNESGVCDVSL